MRATSHPGQRLATGALALLWIALIAACGKPDKAAPPAGMPDMGILAQMPSTGGVEALGDDGVRITAPLVTGEKLVTTIRLDRKRRAPPADTAPAASPLRDFQVSHKPTPEGGLSFRLAYYVPAEAAPPDLWAGLAPPAAESGTRGRWSPLGVAWAQAAPAPDGFGVIMEGVLSTATSEMLAGIEKGTGILMNEFLLQDAQVKDSMFAEGHVTQLASSVNDVMSAMKIKEKFEGWQQRLARARRCAENPTNPLTRKAYQEDPSLRGRNLGELDDAASDVFNNTRVRFIGAINAQFAALSSVKWLGWVTGPATGWADANLEALSEARVAEVERLVPGCDPRHGGWTGTITWEEKAVARESSTYQPPDSGEQGFESEATTFLAVNVGRDSQAESLGMAMAKTELRHNYLKTGYHDFVGAGRCSRSQGTSRESASGGGSGTARVIFAEYPDGRYQISVADVQSIRIKGESRSSVTRECKGTDEESGPIELEAGVSGFVIEGQRQPDSMDVIDGWETRSTGISNITIRWSLQRGVAEKPGISAAP